MASGFDDMLFRHADILTNLASKGATVSITTLPSGPATPTSELPLSITLVLDPAHVTQEFDQLRFEAAAYEQLSSRSADQPSTTQTGEHHLPITPIYSTLLISSPYNNPLHYLNLITLPTPSLLFAKALTALKPMRGDYATAPYTQALNFTTVLSVIQDLARTANYDWKETSFYVVVFRSKLKENIDNDYLYKLDYESHGEACDSGGLLKYWFGKADGERRNLATCKLPSLRPPYLTCCL
jgi:hypothetical protein